MCYLTDICLTQQCHVGVVEMSYNKYNTYVTTHDTCLTQWCHVGVVEMSNNKPVSSVLFVKNS